ncbi:MAG: hypothetical protein IPM03_08550 [Sulfuritalea sp.]|nr:hypothetical protein [Sulfuritalea sp.]
MAKKLNIKESEFRLNVAGCEVVLSPPRPEVAICDSEWLVMNARGFTSESIAKEFGGRLKAAVQISSAVNRLGVDGGIDLPTCSLSDMVRTHIRNETGSDIRSNVHGLDVFLDAGNVGILNFQASGTVLASPTQFLSDLEPYYSVASGVSQRAQDIILLLNYALMRHEPVAQIIFAVSAVEMLGQDETWSVSQKLILKDFAAKANESPIGSVEERAEIALALTKSLHRLSLRQGVLRLLDRLQLGHLKAEWDALYGERSTLVHGLAPRPGTSYDDLANRTIGLCGHILMKAIASEINLVEGRVGSYLPASQP